MINLNLQLIQLKNNSLDILVFEKSLKIKFLKIISFQKYLINSNRLQFLHYSTFLVKIF